ncbi:unnamed protein product [Symbiodinium necroappetens]|uniref:Uncharacterized protein n=1 Tax=Symbiodinium necroappetens TaxID=1628268 RepID=A0A812JPS1_9DINO|nr:unnamed protein product [Symbiodinium necroappetens]
MTSWGIALAPTQRSAGTGRMFSRTVAFFTELRRRARDKDELGKRFFCVLDSLISFYVLGKGRSSLKRLNRVSRLIPMCLWTISKGNFSDGTSYENAVAALFQYLNVLWGRLPRTMAELDEELAEYINHLYQEGDAVTVAGWTLSGLKRFYPRCKPHLLTSQLFLRNWQRVPLPQRTCPMTWLGARAMAGAAYKVGRPDLALSIFLGFAFFLRTMELLSLTIRHLHIFPEEGWRKKGAAGGSSYGREAPGPGKALYRSLQFHCALRQLDTFQLLRDKKSVTAVNTPSAQRSFSGVQHALFTDASLTHRNFWARLHLPATAQKGCGRRILLRERGPRARKGAVQKFAVSLRFAPTGYLPAPSG